MTKVYERFCGFALTSIQHYSDLSFESTGNTLKRWRLRQAGSDGSDKAALSTRTGCDHTPYPNDKRRVVEGNRVEVSESSLLKFVCMMKDLTSVPNSFA